MDTSGKFGKIKQDLEKAVVMRRTPEGPKKDFVSRDRVGRTELHSTKVPNHGGQGCDWCGGTLASGKLKKYHLETDGGTKHEIEGKFCSKDCMETYHG